MIESTLPLGRVCLALRVATTSVVLLISSLDCAAQSKINVRAYIDGRSQLILDGASARWFHLNYNAPGRWDCEDGLADYGPGQYGVGGGHPGTSPVLGAEPTVINDAIWYPQWPDAPDCSNDFCACNSLDTYLGIDPPLPERVFQVYVDKVDCRGGCEVIEEPSAVNGYRVVIEFDDDEPEGPAWYEIDVWVDPVLVEVFLGDEAHPIAGAQIQIAPEGSGAWQDPVAGKPPLVTNEEGIASLAEVDAPGRYHVRAIAFHTLEENPAYVMSVVNYPAWSPDLSFELGLGSDPDIPPIKVPWPVVLQGGLFSGLGAWGGGLGGSNPSMLWFLRDDPGDNAYKRANHLPAFLCYPVPSLNWPGDAFVGGYNNALPGAASHEYNSIVLANWMQGAGSQLVTPHPTDGRAWVPGVGVASIRFDVICHSMGGLITRALATSGDSMGRQIRQVVSLDGVHCGTAYAPYAIAKGFNEKFLNGWEDGVDSFQAWNESHSELDSRPLYLLYSCAATSDYACWDLRNNKIVNPDKSALGVGRHFVQSAQTTTFTEKRFVRGIQVAVPENHTTINQLISHAREAAQFFANGRVPGGAVFSDGDCVSGPACVPDLNCPDWLPTGPLVEPGSLTGRCAVGGGTVLSRLVPFDSNAMVTCGLLISGAGATYQFKDDLGILVPWTLLESQQLGVGATLDSLQFASPVAGNVHLELTASTDDLDAYYGFEFSNGRRLAVAVTSGSIPAGSPLLVTASFVDDQGSTLLGAGGAVVAEVTDPATTVSQIQLLDDGMSGDGLAADGVYGGVHSGTALEGVYAILVEGQVALGGETLARSTSALATVTATGAQFAGMLTESLVDFDGNQLMDVLELRQPVTFTKDGTYRVLGRLKTGLGELIAELRVDVERTSGPGTEDVVFEVFAGELAEAGADGPWTLTSRSITSVDADFLRTDAAADYLTLPHLLVLFELPVEPEPTILIPSSGAEAGGYSVFLQGMELGTINGVFIDAVPAIFSVHSSNSVEIVIPPMTPRPGPRPTTKVRVDVRITTPWHDQTYEGAFSYGRDLLSRK